MGLTPIPKKAKVVDLHSAKSIEFDGAVTSLSLSAKKLHGSALQLHKRILSDAIAMYVATLVENGGSGHSLLKSYAPHDFVKKFVALPIVKECKENRNNRSAHESRQYGFFAPPAEILESDLEKWLSDAMLFVCVIGKQK